MSKSAAKPQIVLRNGKPESVILSIREYEKLLEQAEDAEDLRELKKLRKKKQRFISLDEYAANG